MSDSGITIYQKYLCGMKVKYVKRLAMVLILSIFILSVVAPSQNSQILQKTLPTRGGITYGPVQRPLLNFSVEDVGNLRGVNRQGLQFPTRDVSNYNPTEQDFVHMVNTALQGMNLVAFPLCILNLMPNAENGDYTTIDTTYLTYIDNYVAWAKARGVYVILANMGYYPDEDPADLLDNPERASGVGEFLKFIARRYGDDIIGFDIENEIHGTNVQYYEPIPGQPYGWDGIPHEKYRTFIETVIDMFRSVPEGANKIAFVQNDRSESYGMREFVQNYPIRREMVVYVPHFYNHDWASGAWYDWLPWSKHYQSHNYQQAFEELVNGTESYNGIYERWGFITQELNLPVLLGEFAAPSTEEGMKFMDDLLTILDKWSIGWHYFTWGTYVDRPMTLVAPDWQTLRTMVNVLANYTSHV